MAMMNMTLTLLRAQHVLIMIRDHCQKYQENQKIRGLSRTGFLTQLKCKKVRINREKTSQMSIRRRLSERAVMKENKLVQVCLQQRRLTPNET